MKVYENYYEYRDALDALQDGSILCKTAVLDLLERCASKGGYKLSKADLGFGIWEVNKDDTRTVDEKKHRPMSFRAS